MDSNQDQSHLKVSNQNENDQNQEGVEQQLNQTHVNSLNDNQNKEILTNIQNQNFILKEEQNQNKLEIEKNSQTIYTNIHQEENSENLNSIPISNQINYLNKDANTQKKQKMIQEIHNFLNLYMNQTHNHSRNYNYNKKQKINFQTSLNFFFLIIQIINSQINKKLIKMNTNLMINFVKHQIYQKKNKIKWNQNQFNHHFIKIQSVIFIKEKLLKKKKNKLKKVLLLMNQLKICQKYFIKFSITNFTINSTNSLKITTYEATFLKNQGNQWFQLKNFGNSIQQYNLALGLCDPNYLLQCPEEQLQQFKKLSINLLSNLSACFLNLGDSNSCISHANIVIQLEPQNQKVWYRRALAYQQKQDYEEAQRNIDQAWNIVKNTSQDQEIFEKRKEIKKLLNQSNKDSAQLYQTMFSNNQEQNEGKNTVNQYKQMIPNWQLVNYNKKKKKITIIQLTLNSLIQFAKLQHRQFQLLQ
ncbi:unnamed protein product [Paramecium sonneborni]|uniref:Tetratricopeptide repeat protein n=1 Tax=Paramecium sonneborni TaxID=65129 RepID=A0A8S1KIY5_9CILI|nr:unnamed protein product [Paramecium sonneborni]